MLTLEQALVSTNVPALKVAVIQREVKSQFSKCPKEKVTLQNEIDQIKERIFETIGNRKTYWTAPGLNQPVNA